MVETARKLSGVFMVFVPRPSGLIAALQRDELHFSIDSLAVKHARLVRTQLVKFTINRLDTIERLGGEAAVRTDMCRSRP